MNEFFTIAQESIFEETEKRSKFISYSFRVQSTDDVKEKLNSIKSKYWDAKHHVYAYSLNQNSALKFSDDGEPGGTAGLPIINTIQSQNLTNTLVIVVRYFGGILLGTSGLRKMYSSGAENVLKISGKSKFVLCDIFEIKTDYKQHNQIANLISNFCGTVKNTIFQDDVNISAAIPKSNSAAFFEKFSTLYSNENSIQKLKSEYIEI